MDEAKETPRLVVHHWAQARVLLVNKGARLKSRRPLHNLGSSGKGW